MTFLKDFGVSLFLAAIGSIFLIALARSEPVYVKNCSGTYIGSGYVLTAGHCMDQTELFVAKANPAKDEDEGTTEKFTAKIVWSAVGRDVGILKLDKSVVKTTKEEREDGKEKTKEAPLKAIPFKVSKVSCEVPKIGSNLTMKGWPIGEYVEVRGYVSSETRKVATWDVVQFVSMPGFFGNSGSGVMNDKDEVVAVMVGILQGSGLMIQVPTSEICNILPKEVN